MRLFPADVRMNPVPTAPTGAPFAHRPYLLPPRSAVRVTAGAAAQRSERTLDAGEYRGPLNGRCQVVFYPQILLKTHKKNCPFDALGRDERRFASHTHVPPI